MCISLVFVVVIIGSPASGVSGYVWTDSNKNGMLENWEPRVNEVFVALKECDSGKMVERTATGMIKDKSTGKIMNGYYHFGRFVDKGKYFVGTFGMTPPSSACNTHFGK